MKGDCSKTILLVGNPNTGKTTLFNKLTASNEHIGNWHGVTVEEKRKNIKFNGKCVSVVDLPGIYSLKSLSYEEQVAIDYIQSHKDCKVINICDENNIERNLFLTLCLIEEGIDVVLAVNSTLKKPICVANSEKLSRELGIEVVKIDAQRGTGLDGLLQKAMQKGRTKVLKSKADTVEDAKDKYAKIENIVKKTCTKTKEVYGKSKVDKILLNRAFAPFIFLGIMGVIFYLTFFLIGSPLSALLSSLLDASLGKWLNALFSSCFGQSHWLTLLVGEAIIGGIGTILSFLPQIVLLFFFLSVLEDSGYLSRVAFIFDDILSKIGLSGKSIYTLLLGFGCSASAILTARNMDDKKAKIKTVLITPFLSCSARLPIYLAVGGAFFGTNNVFVIMLLYVIGIIVATGSSFLLDRSLLKSKEQSFLLEFPPYRLVSLKRALKVLCDNVKSFVFRIGGLLISMNVIVWLLCNFSFSFAFVGSEGGGSMIETIAKFIAPIFSPLGFSSWGIVVALIVGIVAKEGVLSTMAMLCGGDLVSGLFLEGGAIAFSSTSSVLAFLTFCLLYVPCLSTIAVMGKEVGKKWTLFAVGMQLFVAYFMSMIIYNISKICFLYGIGKILLVVFAVMVICFSVIRFLGIFKKKACKGCKDCRK